MRFLHRAKINNPPGYADRQFLKDNSEPLSRGDEIELSGAAHELVMNEQSDYRQKFGEVFEFVREVPQTPEEEKRAKPRLLKAELMEEKKTDLVKDAEKLGVPTSLNKEPLVDAIVEVKTAEDERKAEAVETTLTAASGAENPKARKGGKR